MTTFRLDPSLSEVAMLGEIADRIGCTDQHLYNLRDRYVDFPTPIRKFGRARVYLIKDVEYFYYELWATGNAGREQRAWVRAQREKAKQLAEAEKAWR